VQINTIVKCPLRQFPVWIPKGSRTSFMADSSRLPLRCHQGLSAPGKVLTTVDTDSPRQSPRSRDLGQHPYQGQWEHRPISKVSRSKA